MIVVDARVLIAFLDHNDEHHAAAIEQIAQVQRFVVHPLTLAEVLVHPVRAAVEDDVLARLAATGMTVSPLSIDPADLARTRVRTGLKMPDCVVLVCAAAHGAEIATSDEQLAAEERLRRSA